MAHKKSGGSSRNGRDSQGQRFGAKAFAGQIVTGGSVLVRQCGNRFWPGRNVGQGRDFSLYAEIPGQVQYDQRGRRGRRYIEIVPLEKVASDAPVALQRIVRRAMAREKEKRHPSVRILLRDLERVSLRSS